MTAKVKLCCLLKMIKPYWNWVEKCLQTTYPDMKILYMSGYTANIIAHRGVLEKGVNFISKPFSKKEFAAEIRKAIGNSSN